MYKLEITKYYCFEVDETHTETHQYSNINFYVDSAGAVTGIILDVCNYFSLWSDQAGKDITPDELDEEITPDKASQETPLNFCTFRGLNKEERQQRKRSPEQCDTVLYDFTVSYLTDND